MSLRFEFNQHKNQVINNYLDSTATTIANQLTSGEDFHLLLTGGQTGTDFSIALGNQIKSRIVSGNNKSNLHLWWSDERFVEVDDTDRNDTVAIKAFDWLGKNLIAHRTLPPSKGNINESANDLSEQYQKVLGEQYFDMCFLGFGNDGHLASCFPDQVMVLNSTLIALPITNSPKPPPNRVTFTLTTLSRSKQVVIFAFGTEKAGSLIALKDSKIRDEKCPVRYLEKFNPELDLVVLSDQDI